MSKKKNIGLILVVTLVVIGSIIGSITMITKANNNKYLENIDLGKKYVLEGRYKEAILAFEKASKIKDKNPEAEQYINEINTYLEIEQAYKGNDYDKVLALIQKLNEINNANLFEETVLAINKNIEDKKSIMSEIDSLENNIDLQLASNSFDETLNIINQYKEKELNDEYTNKLEALDLKVTEAKSKYEEEQRKLEEERKRKEEELKKNQLSALHTKMLGPWYHNDGTTFDLTENMIADSKYTVISEESNWIIIETESDGFREKWKLQLVDDNTLAWLGGSRLSAGELYTR